MPIITKPALAKGDSVFFTLDKTALAAVGSVAADPFLASPNNWEKVVIEFDSSESNQSKVVVFDPSQTTPEGLFFTTVNARGDFLVRKINIYGPQGYKLVIPRASLTAAEFDVIFATGPTTWSSTYKQADISLTGNDYIATWNKDPLTGEGAVAYIDKSIPYVGSDKYYVEVTLNSQTTVPRLCYGMRVFNTVPSDFATGDGFEPMNDEVAELYYERFSGALRYSINNGSKLVAQSGYGTRTNGDVLMFAIDTALGKAWFGTNGTWAYSGDPATGTNGNDYESLFTGVANRNNIYIGFGELHFTGIAQMTINETPLYLPSGFTQL